MDNNALLLGLVLDDFGCLGVAADQRGLGRNGKASPPQKSDKMDGSHGGMVLQDVSVPHMHLRAIIYPSLNFDWLVGSVHLIEDVVKEVPRVGHRCKTPSYDAEVGDLDPRADELALFEGSGAAVPEDREP